MTDWVPDITPIPGPRYLAFIMALEADIAAGHIKPGMRLLPQRDMAQRLDLSVGTVSKAYAKAEQRGLIFGEVGRGTFVQRRRPGSDIALGTLDATVNLALDASPYTGEDDLIASTIGEIVTSGGMPGLLGHLPPQGLRRHRVSIANWLSPLGVVADIGQIFITHGSQHALALALGTVARRGDTILTEPLTSSGMLALSVQNSYCLQGVASDAEGLIPESLDLAFAETGARVIHCMPTLQTPSGAIMSPVRRQGIAAVVRKHDAYLVEDDACAYLLTPPLPPVSALIPERSFYVMSFARCLAPGLRIAAVVTPDSLCHCAMAQMRAADWTAVPLMAEVVARLISNGGLARQARLKREKTALRNAIARRVLQQWLPPSHAAPGLHIWLPLPDDRAMRALITQAAQAGITLAPPDRPEGTRTEHTGVRLCIGAPATEHDLERALTGIRRILEMAAAISFA